MTNEQIETYYTELKNGKMPPIIGQALIKDKWVNVEFIERTIVKENLQRVISRDEQNRRVTTFVSPEHIRYNSKK